ncbi:MAG: extracellular solute-binding protein [Synergistaceae bacterium]|jgi:ABC-type glycerol-3-phosphate transport system substrate-binding protein|nr:extracellular solute-binding protein [Synergistaceae bacterium]
MITKRRGFFMFLVCFIAAMLTTGAVTRVDAADKRVTIKLFGMGYTQLTNFPGYESRTQNAGDFLHLMAEKFMETHPNVKVEVEMLNPNASGGGTSQLDVEIAAGNIPNIVTDNVMRLSKYYGEDLIEDLDSHLSDEYKKDFLPGLFSPGNTWRIPLGLSAHFVVVNRTAFEKAGKLNLLPSSESREWTVDQFMEAARAINNPPEMNATMLFAKNQSGDLSWMSFFWGFGARLFKNGDYTKTTLNSPEGEAALKFFKNILDQGLCPPSPSSLVDDDMWAYWEQNKIGVVGGYEVLKEFSDKQGFDAYFVNYPSTPGNENPPLATMGESVVVFKTDDKAQLEASIEFAKEISEIWGPLMQVLRGDYPVRSSQTAKVPLGPESQAVLKLIEKNGLVDFGLSSPKYYLVRE